MPLYVPPVPPDPIEIRHPVELTGDSRLEVRGDGLVARIGVRDVPHAGWLALQWYDPMLRQVASDSIWVEAATDVQRHLIAAPASVDVRPGRWRLVLTFDGMVLRQLEAVVP